MGKIIMDTHMHSKASDGLWTPSQVVAQAKKRGLEVIALTDHDYTFGVKEAIDAGKREGIRVIPGIEIDAEYKKGGVLVQDIELLGLGIDLKVISEFVLGRADARLRSMKHYLQVFNEYIHSPEFTEKNSQMFFPLENPANISLEDILAWKEKRNNYENPVPFLSKMDMVYFILEHFAIPYDHVKIAVSGDKVYGGIFKKEYGFLLDGMEIKPSFKEAIDAVHRAGGLAVVAHPGISRAYHGGMIKEWKKNPGDWFWDHDGLFTPFKFAKELAEHGLDGIEQYYYAGNDPEHRADHELINEYFRRVTEKLQLRTTYGSDCHGPKAGGPHIGKFGSEEIYF